MEGLRDEGGPNLPFTPPVDPAPRDVVRELTEEEMRREALREGESFRSEAMVRASLNSTALRIAKANRGAPGREVPGLSATIVERVAATLTSIPLSAVRSMVALVPHNILFEPWSRRWRALRRSSTRSTS